MRTIILHPNHLVITFALPALLLLSSPTFVYSSVTVQAYALNFLFSMGNPKNFKRSHFDRQKYVNVRMQQPTMKEMSREQKM